MLEKINNIQYPKSKNFFLLAGPCAIENEEMALTIAEKILKITSKLEIPFIFKGSYKKANRSRLDSFTGIGDIGFTEGGNYLNFYSTFGLRYQNPKGGLNFKIGLSPIYLNIEGVRETINFPHLSLGYSW